jgi:hypothetical protein
MPLYSFGKDGMDELGTEADFLFKGLSSVTTELTLKHQYKQNKKL